MAHLEPSQSKDPDLVSAGQTKVKQYNTTEYLQSLLDFSTPDKTTTSAKTGYKLEHVENDSIPLPVHLTPFTPYVEKCPYTLSLDYGSSTLPRDWIRLSTIRNWILECDSNHSCKDDGKNSRQVLSPPCLIDVKRRCLTQDTKGISYVALSYVWGRKESACTTIDNLKLLLEPGSLEKEQTTPPQTILDVMELVESIGERYLWVDRFCIVQDDITSKEGEFHKMGDVYANSVLTVCAAENEDPTAGLYDVRRVRDQSTGEPHQLVSYTDISSPPPCRKARPHSLLTPFGSISANALMHQNRTLGHARRLMRSAWYSRSWTFQEFLFAPRKLLFHNNTVNWECLCAAWHEDQDPGEGNCHLLTIERRKSTKQSFTGGFGYTPWPDMVRFSRLVSVFNDRILTFPEDVLEAFAGVLSTLSNTFEGGFISGLPVFCFDSALLWQPWRPMERRVPRRRITEDSVLPSWSWAGWSGVTHSESWRSACSYMKQQGDGAKSSWRTANTVSWRYSTSLDGERIFIPTSKFATSLSLSHQVENLPEGWSCGKDQHGVLVYRHKCHPSQIFFYPIPIRDPGSEPALPVYARYLHGKTRRAFFQFGPEYNSKASRCVAVDLLTTSGDWAGTLRLNDSVTRPEDAAELVEISIGSVDDEEIEKFYFDEWDRPQCPRSSGRYNFYSVLWVEWIDGVAYRKALGRVEKSIWEATERDGIDLVLG